MYTAELPEDDLKDFFVHPNKHIHQVNMKTDDGSQFVHVCCCTSLIISIVLLLSWHLVIMGDSLQILSMYL